MQLPQVFVLTGLSSPLVQSFLILLLFAGSLSTVPVAAPAEKHLTGNATSFPLVFLERNARPFAPAALDEQKKLTRPIRSDSEATDLQNANVSKAEATVDSDQSEGSPQNESAPGTTEHSVPLATTTDSIPSVSGAPASVNASSNVGVATESTPANTSTSTQASTTTSIVTTDAPTTVMETTMPTMTMTTIPPTAEPQTDPPEVTTIAALIEDKGGMPTGVIAMVTMITFMIIAVVGYVSLIVWRRYLEYRYGNRELLVNDLEFDTNDLRHFEL